MMFVPPRNMIVYETSHWLINQRVNCPFPGYLMIGAKSPDACELTDLSLAAQQEIGVLLGKATGFLRSDLGASRVYVGRYGHTPGHTVHFHVIPVYSWIISAFESDERYNMESNPDGVDLMRFIWREYCEKTSSLPCGELSMEKGLRIIREKFEEN